jgi:peptide-methionine (R)-S-oxide reductase
MAKCFFLVIVSLLLLLTPAVAFAANILESSKHRTKRILTMKPPASNGDNKEAVLEAKTWNPLRLLVLKLGFTEPAWTSPLNYGKLDGIFRCAFCGQDLFDSDAKYDSGSGWPSFWRSIEDGAISYKMEWDGRLECRCGRCSSHLGHVFLDGPLPSQVSAEMLELSPASDPRGKQANGYLPRFCINGASLRYDKRESEGN